MKQLHVLDLISLNMQKSISASCSNITSAKEN